MCLAVLLVQLPMLRASFAAKPSLHAGVPVDDPATEACIDMLWEMSALVQQREPADAIKRLGFTEPVSHQRYAVTDVDGVMVVACPNPEVHGLRSLRVTATDPMPEAAR